MRPVLSILPRNPESGGQERPHVYTHKSQSCKTKASHPTRATLVAAAFPDVMQRLASPPETDQKHASTMQERAPTAHLGTRLAFGRRRGMPTSLSIESPLLVDVRNELTCTVSPYGCWWLQMFVELLAYDCISEGLSLSVCHCICL